MFKKMILPISIAALLAACGDDSSSTSTTGPEGTPTNTPSDNKPSSDTKEDASGCTFKKEAKVWEYSENFMGIRDVYTWQDETTVKHEIWMNDYHLDEKDEVLTDVDRDSLYKEVMEDCEFYNKETEEPAFATAL